SVAISQDGTTIVSGSADNTVRVWNSHSGKLLNELKGHSDWVRSVAISQDGTTIVSGSHDKTVRVWNSHSGKLLNELKGHSHWVRSVAISQDGTTIVSGSNDNTVRVWSVQNGNCVHVWYLNNVVTLVRFNIDQNCIVVNNNKVFSISTFTELDPFYELFDTSLNLVVDNWVLKTGMRLFWLPTSFRPTHSYAAVLNNITVAIGTNSGRVVIISLSPDKWESVTVTKKNKVEKFLANILKLKK
ncbi:WD40-repeat-containing domain protein, partial [Cyathus striatus]